MYIYVQVVSLYINVLEILKLDTYPSMKASLNIAIHDHLYQRRNRQYNTLFPRVESIMMSYKYQFVKAWNELSPELKCKHTLRSFKTALIQSFIEGY